MLSGDQLYLLKFQTFEEDDILFTNSWAQYCCVENAVGGCSQIKSPMLRGGVGNKWETQPILGLWAFVGEHISMLIYCDVTADKVVSLEY